MLPSQTLDNQEGLTPSASPKFTVECAGPRSPHTTQGRGPALLIAEKFWLGLWCPRCAQGQESKSTHSFSLSPSSPAVRDSIKWGLTLCQVVSYSENSAKDSCHLLAYHWLVSWLLIQVIVCLLKNISTAKNCFSLLLSYTNLFSFCMFTIHLSHLPTSYFYFCLFLPFILNHTF